MITAFYASLLALLYVYLSLQVIKARGKEKIALGTGASDYLQQRIRAHANFGEYTPMVVILLLLLELQEVSPYYIHAFAVLYIIGRLVHLYGMVYSEQYSQGKLQTTTHYRKYGMICTFWCLIGLATSNLVLFVM